MLSVAFRKYRKDISNIIFSQIIRQMNLYKIVDEKVSEGRLRKVGNVGGKLLSDFLKNSLAIGFKVLVFTKNKRFELYSFPIVP